RPARAKASNSGFMPGSRDAPLSCACAIEGACEHPNPATIVAIAPRLLCLFPMRLAGQHGQREIAPVLLLDEPPELFVAHPAHGSAHLEPRNAYRRAKFGEQVDGDARVDQTLPVAVHQEPHCAIVDRVTAV